MEYNAAQICQNRGSSVNFFNAFLILLKLDSFNSFRHYSLSVVVEYCRYLVVYGPF